MIAMKSKENIKINYGGVSSKRPRLVHILNNESNQTHMDYNKIVNLPHLGSVKKSQKKKKRTTGNKVAPNTEWAKRVLESQAPISLKEVFILKPKLIKDFIKSLQQFEKKKERGILFAEYPPSDTDSESNEDSGSESDEDEEVPPLSYLTTYVNKEPIPLFLDPGAAYSIISAELLKSLRLYAVNLKAPIKIKPVSGKVVEILKEVELPIEFDDGIVVGIPFIVLKECDVPILLGLDACMRLKSKINYEEETYSINIRNKKHTYQLYSKEMLSDEFVANTNIEPSEIDESVPLLYASIESEISEAAYLDPSFVEVCPKTEFKEDLNKNINESLNPLEKGNLKGTMEEFEDIFAKNLEDITEIVNSDYALKIDEETPFSSKLRIYSPQEKDIIKAEISVMFEHGIIEKSTSEWVYPFNW
ncbi:hypothetical protein AYI70_g10602 [Smittium culicis]|uniref:Uncharacterized protein n=1 Tax=Smittium culicis TaxID=133412 RepID=A0A1R1X5W1_9FUNG|nr:hypothetical protein AYI70_g10602 [Smittium culicis]